MERQIKLVVRNRKNAGFFKSAVGAAVGDIITSLIATTTQASIHAFDNFNAIQRYAKKVKAHPEQWLPWCYESALLKQQEQQAS